MKNLFLVILFALLFTACNNFIRPAKTETRVYELTFVDGESFIYTFEDVDVNASEGIAHSLGGYYFYVASAGRVEAVIRFKRLK